MILNIDHEKGKIALGLKVVTTEGENPTPGRLWLRAAVRGAFHGALYSLFPVGLFLASSGLSDASWTRYYSPWSEQREKAWGETMAVDCSGCRGRLDCWSYGNLELLFPSPFGRTRLCGKNGLSPA